MNSLQLTRHFQLHFFYKSNINFNSKCSFSTNNNLLAGSNWRLSKGLGKCGNEYGPLNSIPDWSYEDGQPAPLSYKKSEKFLKQFQLTKTVKQSIYEMDMAKEHLKKVSMEQNETRQQLINLKIKKDFTDD